ncbi:MAG: Dabb family protein [Planctomycetaceae bacterium]
MTRMNWIPSLVLGMAMGIVTMLSGTARADEALVKSGETVVFLGDSITQGGAQPGGYVRLAEEVLAKKGIKVIGAGISGNKVPDLEGRLERDVLSKKPNLVVIYIGINDVWHSKNGKGTPKDVFETGLKSLIKRNADIGARTLLCTASVIGEKTDGSNSLDGMLKEYCEISRKVAKDTNTPLLDLNAAFAHHLKKNNKENKESGVLTTDGVHLNGEGNKFVANQMLSALLPAKKGMLRHVVLFKFKPEVTPAQVNEVVDAFRALPSKISEIKGFECGTDCNVEDLDAGFTHCFFVTFADAKGREIYLPHPAHEEFKKLVGPRIEKVLVVDYYVQE